MKTFFPLLLVLMAATSARATDVVAPLKSQNVQVLGEEPGELQTSCRLYRKRMEMFLQRINEASVAAAVHNDKIDSGQSRRLIDIMERADVPLELKRENVQFTLDFDTTAAAEFLNTPSAMVTINSTYLQWQTDQALFPDHFRVDLVDDLKTARVTYKMTYMEACLAPVSVAIKIATDENSAQMQTWLDRNLL